VVYINKVELLWLWYDYHTEKYDQQFSDIPCPHDEGAVMLIGKQRYLSNSYAMRLHKEIHSIAKFYKITVELMSYEKRFRLQETTKSRMEKYEWIMENLPHEYMFIEDYHKQEEMELKVKRINLGLL
jgi:hypothetical protein